jgi:S-adenosylmethionine hydrolase
MSVTIETIGDVRFARLNVVNLGATVRKASWMVKTASYDAFGTVAYSIPSDLAQHIRAELKLGADVNVGIATRASFDDVQGWNALLESRAGQAFAVRGSASLTVGVDATDAVKQSVDKDGNTWVNLTLVLTDEVGEWVDRPSSLATTSRLLQHASK